jgi:hypothetical protein
MASLIIHSNGQNMAGVFGRRVLIGRKPFNGVQFEQRAVSRIHAWIDRQGESFYIADAHSRAGTTVNGQHVKGKTTLREGDVIGIGPEKLTFHLGNDLPADAITFSIAENGTNPDYDDQGILIKCGCGAPLWVPASMAGAYGHCVHCQAEIDVPGAPAGGVRRPLTPNDSLADMPAIRELGSAEPPHDPLAAHFPRPKPHDSAEQTCGICLEPIRADEPAIACPSCSQSYHDKCWKQNGGCAAYGCLQAGLFQPAPVVDAAMAHLHDAAPPPAKNALPLVAPKRAVPVTSVPFATAAPPQPPPPVVLPPKLSAPSQIPLDLALLGGSVFGTILGAFTFGVPALAMGATSAVYALRGRDERRHTARIAAVSTAICVLDVAVGVFTSMLLWFNGSPWAHR